MQNITDTIITRDEILQDINGITYLADCPPAKWVDVSYTTDSGHQVMKRVEVNAVLVAIITDCEKNNLPYTITKFA